MAISGDGGKGYGRRKPLVPDEVIEDNWSKIFGKTEPAYKSKTEQVQDRQTAVDQDLGLDEK